MRLDTPRKVIDALGGFRAVAEITNRKVTAAENWRRLPRLPANTYRALRDALEAKGLEAPDSLWGM